MGEILQNVGQRELQRRKKEIQELKAESFKEKLPIFETWDSRNWLNRFFGVTGEDKILEYLKKGLGEVDLEKVIDNLRKGKEKLAPIVRKPPYATFPEWPEIKGLTDYKPFKGERYFTGLTDDGYIQRLKALLYLSPLSPKFRNLGWIEELNDVGQMLEREIADLEEKINSASPEKRDEILKKIEEKKRLFKAVNDVLEWREERLKKVREGWEEYHQHTKELMNPSAVKVLETINRPFKNPHLNLALGKILGEYEALHQKAMKVLGLLQNDYKSKYHEYRIDKNLDWEYLKELFPNVHSKMWDFYRQKWEKLYLPLAEWASARLNTNVRMVWELKRWFFQDILLTELAREVGEADYFKRALLYEAFTDYYKAFKDKLPEELKKALENALKRARLKEKRKIILEEDLKTLKEIINDYVARRKEPYAVLLRAKEILREAEEYEKALKGIEEDAKNVYLYPLFLPVKRFFGTDDAKKGIELLKRKLREEIEKKKSTKNITAEGEYGELTYNLMNDYFSLESKLRGLKNPSFVDDAVSVFNLDVLKERARSGKLPLKSISDEEIAQVLGVSPESEIVKSVRTVLREYYQRRLERTVEKYPLSNGEYLKMMRDVAYLTYARKLLKKVPVSLFLSEKVTERMDREKKNGMRILLDGTRRGLFAVGLSLNTAGVKLYECLREATYPPDRWKMSPGTRFRDCIEKYLGELSQSAKRWEQYALSMGEISPVNPFKFPIAVVSLWFALLRSWQSGYAEAHYHLFQEGLRREADRLLYLSPNEIDEEIKRTIYDVTGVRFDVKDAFLLTRLEREETLVEPSEILKEAKELLEKGETEKAREKLSLLLTGTEKEELLDKVGEIPFEEIEREVYNIVNPHDLKVTLFSSDASKALVVTVNAEKLKEMGEKELVEELKRSGQEKGREILLKRLGISPERVRALLDRGEIRNGMEYHEIWENVANSLAAQVVREVRRKEELLTPELGESENGLSDGNSPSV